MVNFETSFDVTHSETIENENQVANFWTLALNKFIEEKDYLKKLAFFMNHNLKFDKVYIPKVYHIFHSSSTKEIYDYFHHEMTKQGFDTTPLPLEELIVWYYSNINTLQDPEQMNIVEKKNYFIFQRRFELNVYPNKNNSDQIIAYNLFLESQLIQSMPSLSFKMMKQSFENVDILDKKIQIKTHLFKIQNNAKKWDIVDPKSQNDLMQIEKLEGYNDLRIQGEKWVPYDRKITNEYILGKNIAIFEIYLINLLSEIENPKEITLNKQEKQTRGYKILYLLMKEFGMLSDDKFSKLTAVKKAKLLSFLFNLESEGIRQDLSKANDFINEGNNKIELEKLINEVNAAKQIKGKKS